MFEHGEEANGKKGGRQISERNEGVLSLRKYRELRLRVFGLLRVAASTRSDRRDSASITQRV
jgi:hypothetical protein